jgi:hypothetical protein
MADIATLLALPEPTVELALALGVRDRSYQSTNDGRVTRYVSLAQLGQRGQGGARPAATVTMADGGRWECWCVPPQGNAYTCTAHGRIEWVRVD